ncbi:MAG: hypothetical protein LBI11_04065 [Streptococcaceae bacterium]|jgi:hypothetical protein|nr:hypothetical protein [Streptococcaceae bacterium]
MEKDFNARLAAMRARYLENFPEDAAAQQAQMDAFKKMSAEEKVARIGEALALLADKKALLKEKFQAYKTAGKDTHEIEEHLALVAEKMQHLEEKLAWSRSDAADPVRKERLKRQLTTLEIKRCKAQLEQKKCGKIDEKIAAKRSAFHRAFSKNAE